MDRNEQHPNLWIPFCASARNTPLMDTWRDRAKARMKQLGISQERLAEVFDMTTAGMQKWLAGTRQPSLDEINRIADQLKVPHTWLTHGLDAATHIQDLPTHSNAVLRKLIERERSNPLPNSFWAAVESMTEAIAPSEESSDVKSDDNSRSGTHG